jgi:hypothetical protein
MLVLRFIVSQSFLVIFHAGGRPLNIRRLLFLIAAAKQKHACLAQHRVVHPIPRSPIDSEFAKPFTERLAISKLSECETIQANSYLRFGPGIFQTRKPFSIYIFASAANIAAEFDH